jgi:beta-lactamase superfamily II metal-dependent hydrolase
MVDGKMKKRRRRRTTTTSSSAAKVDKDSEQLNRRKIRIRMYRIGFGDCFLLSLPAENGEGTDLYSHHILIDCGVHAQGDIGTMEKVVDNIAEVTDRKLKIIIATHAHRDHIYGFGRFADVFSKLKVGEVWLPWTWDENNEEALKLQKKHAALTDKLLQHFQALGASADPDALNAVVNVAGNQHAIELLKSGFGNDKVKVRYLKAGDTLKPGDISIIPTLLARVLGPPQSKDFLAQMNPPSGQSYLRAGPNGTIELVNAIQPFGRRWKADPPAAASTYLRLSAEEEKQLQDLSGSSINDLAFALDQARNNESLVILFIFFNKYLLFAGDAQYGNWRWWLENERSSGDILSKINFFKIAHHGSHNATPKAALEKMADGEFAAMVSTQSKPWKSIPRVPLMSRLDEKTKKRIVRSDWLSVEGAPEPLPDTVPTMPSKLPEGFSKGDFWFDYIIEV